MDNHPEDTLRPYIQSVCGLIRGLDKRDNIAEIGVFRGETSYNILLNSPESHLYMVDVWEPLEATPTQRTIDLGGQEVLDLNSVEDNYQTALSVTEFAAARRTIVKATSEKAAQIVPNDLDLVFIDANHSYEYVLQDIQLWWPKVRSGGVLCGHDYHHKFYGVQRAVREMAAVWNLEIRRLRGTIWWWARP